MKDKTKSIRRYFLGPKHPFEPRDLGLLRTTWRLAFPQRKTRAYYLENLVRGYLFDDCQPLRNGKEQFMLLGMRFTRPWPKYPFSWTYHAGRILDQDHK